VLNQVICTTFFGVHIDEGLNWKAHTSYIANKICKRLGVIKRVYTCICSILQLHFILLFTNSVYYLQIEIIIHMKLRKRNEMK